MKKLLLSGTAVALMTIGVDGPAKAASPMVYNWTGCYIGANAGGAWTHKDFGANPSIGFPGAGASASGFAGGGQIGCDFQSGMWVFGVQGLFDGASMHADSPFFIGKGFSAHVPWFATATGRVGYTVQPNLLVFARGGAAFVHDEYQFIHGVGASATQTRVGWTIGGGVEWTFAPNWSVAVEYGYMDFGTGSVGFNALGLTSEDVRQTVQVGLVSLNYRFSSWGMR